MKLSFEDLLLDFSLKGPQQINVISQERVNFGENLINSLLVLLMVTPIL